MIDKKTVFILGAGASCPYGYPSGAKLREEIIDNFVADYKECFQTQKGLSQKKEENDELFSKAYEYRPRAEEFVEALRKANTKSIDSFLAPNSGFELLGKRAIIFRILFAEKKSQDRKNQSEEQDWYCHILHKLTDGLERKEGYKLLGENKISFITFNYDCSLEHFLFESLFNHFNDVGKAEIDEQLKKLKIIHVFGQVTGLDWQDTKSCFGYTRKITWDRIEQLKDNLEIMYERNDNPELKEAKKLIKEAERIFCLGFGFAPENVDILKLSESMNSSCSLYGTALDLENGQIELIKDRICKGFRNEDNRDRIRIENMDCLRLLKKYL